MEQLPQCVASEIEEYRLSLDVEVWTKCSFQSSGCII